MKKYPPRLLVDAKHFKRHVTTGWCYTLDHEFTRQELLAAKDEYVHSSEVAELKKAAWQDVLEIIAMGELESGDTPALINKLKAVAKAHVKGKS